MSLVHQALRKAAAEKLRQQGGAPAVPPPAARQAGTGAPVLAAPPPAGPTSGSTLPHVPHAASAPSSTTRAVHRRRHPWVLAIIFVAFLVVVVGGLLGVYVLTTRTGARGAASPTPTALAPPTGALTAVRPSAPAPAPAPTTPPPPAASAEPAGFSLTGIMKDGDGRICAVLNGRVVYETYAVGGAIVKQIATDRVTITVDGQEQVLRLY